MAKDTLRIDSIFVELTKIFVFINKFVIILLGYVDDKNDFVFLFFFFQYSEICWFYMIDV